MKRILSAFIVLFLLLSLILPGFSAYQTTSYQMISDHVKLISSNRDAYLIGYSGGDCHIEKLSPDSGGSDLRLTHPITAVGVFGGTVVALCNDADNHQLEVYTYRADTDILDSFCIGKRLYYRDCGFYYSDNSIFLVSDRYDNIVERYSSSGVLTDRYTFNSAVTQLGADYHGNLFAVSAKKLYDFNGSRFVAVGGSDVTVPVSFFGDSLLSDSSGGVYRISGHTCRLLFKADSDFTSVTPAVISDTVYYPCGAKIYGYRINSGEKAAEIALSQKVFGLYASNGCVCAVSNSGKPTVNQIRPGEFIDLTPKRTADAAADQPVTPAASSKRESVISSSAYRIDFRNYRISGIPAGTTFAAFKKNISHDGYAVSLYRDGKQIKTGLCGTAMTVVFDCEAAKYTFELSVIGDITGEGNVNSRDLSLFMEYLIGTADFNGVYTISADLSGDGIADAKDLAMMHRMI